MEGDGFGWWLGNSICFKHGQIIDNNIGKKGIGCHRHVRSYMQVSTTLKQTSQAVMFAFILQLPTTTTSTHHPHAMSLNPHHCKQPQPPNNDNCPTNSHDHLTMTTTRATTGTWRPHEWAGPCHWMWCGTHSTLPSLGYSIWNPWNGGWRLMDSMDFPDGFHTV